MSFLTDEFASGTDTITARAIKVTLSTLIVRLTADIANLSTKYQGAFPHKKPLPKEPS